jgi:hypothetical protein
MSEIKLGMKVKDKVTGFTGIVEHIVHWLHMCPQVCVVPDKLSKEGTIKGGAMIDLPQLEILSAKSVMKIQPLPEQRFQFGQKVKDTITGFDGKLIGRAIYLNGCSRVCVQPEYSQKTDVKLVSGIWFPEGQIEAVGKVIQPPKEKTEIKTGGPSVKAYSFQTSSKR